MTRCILCCVSFLTLLAATVAAHAAEPIARNDCEAGITRLDSSQAEGEERLAEKREVIEQCFRQYQRDKTIKGLVAECAKYEEQPVVKQQFVAECQLAAFNYANALRSLKAEYKK
jgi:hypothetical protein